MLSLQCSVHVTCYVSQLHAGMLSLKVGKLQPATAMFEFGASSLTVLRQHVFTDNHNKWGTREALKHPSRSHWFVQNENECYASAVTRSQPGCRGESKVCLDPGQKFPKGPRPSALLSLARRSCFPLLLKVVTMFMHIMDIPYICWRPAECDKEESIQSIQFWGRSIQCSRKQQSDLVSHWIRWRFTLLECIYSVEKMQFSSRPTGAQLSEHLENPWKGELKHSNTVAWQLKAY